MCACNGRLGCVHGASFLPGTPMVVLENVVSSRNCCSFHFHISRRFMQNQLELRAQILNSAVPVLGESADQIGAQEIGNEASLQLIYLL